MPALPQISEAEFEVMKIVWKSAPINTNEIRTPVKNHFMECKNNPDSYKTPCDKRRFDLQKTRACICLYPFCKRR